MMAGINPLDWHTAALGAAVKVTAWLSPRLNSTLAQLTHLDQISPGDQSVPRDHALPSKQQGTIQDLLPSSAASTAQLCVSQLDDRKMLGTLFAVFPLAPCPLPQPLPLLRELRGIRVWLFAGMPKLGRHGDQRLSYLVSFWWNQQEGRTSRNRLFPWGLALSVLPQCFEQWIWGFTHWRGGQLSSYPDPRNIFMEELWHR